MQGEAPASANVESAPSGLIDPARWVDEYGDYLFKFALGRLRDPARAEDAVQETFLAALKGSHKFAGRSAEKSWLVGILKNKIYDYYRKSSHEISFTDLGFYAKEEQDHFIPETLDKKTWNRDTGPRQWEQFGQSLDNEIFWRTYRACAEKLPEKIAVAFNLREVDGLASKEVCALLKITENNLWVMLHRARMALRKCLETHWFAEEK